MSDYARVPLRTYGGAIRAFALVDPCDLFLVEDMRWCLDRHGYAIHGGRKGQPRVWLHRHILGLEHGDGWCVDHINHVVLDNRRVNLRVCSRAENNQNRIPLRGGSSRFRGVVRDSRAERWIAHASVGRTFHHIGVFAFEEDAADAAAAFRREHMPFSREAVA